MREYFKPKIIRHLAVNIALAGGLLALPSTHRVMAQPTGELTTVDQECHISEYPQLEGTLIIGHGVNGQPPVEAAKVFNGIVNYCLPSFKGIRMSEWVEKLNQTMSQHAGKKYLAGDSLGARTALEYLEREDAEKVESLTLGAGRGPNAQLRMDPGDMLYHQYDQQLDLQMVLNKVRGPISIVHCNNDNRIPLEDELDLQKGLTRENEAAPPIIDCDDGHISADSKPFIDTIRTDLLALVDTTQNN